MKKYCFTICFIGIVIWGYSQESWSKILKTNTFEIIKNKKRLPVSVFRKIKIGNISKIANPQEKWNSSCIQSEGDKTSTAKFNWAATDNENWIVSITTGGYAVVTTCFLIAKGLSIEQITFEGWEELDFDTFKGKYLDGSIDKNKICID